jgi:fucose permease
VSTCPGDIVKIFVKDRGAQSWIYGFFLLGVLVGCIGPLLIVWQYHIDTNPEMIGFHFLAFNAGYVAAQAISGRLLLRFPIRSVAVSSCLLGFLSLLSLSFVVPPVPAAWRMIGLGFAGLAAGGLAASLLHILESHFSRSTASAFSYAGSLLGLGCTAATAIVALTYFAGSVQIETVILAALPLLFVLLFAGNKSPEGRKPFRPCDEQERQHREVKDIRSVAAALFALLIFFQSGNEWVLAGWLPLFLIHRLGTNPVLAIFTLAVYFLALTVGRLAVRPLLLRIDHRRLLLSSIIVAVIGYLLLSLTTSLTGAFIAAVITGLGFAPIYPLLAETLDDRFSYHVGFYHRIFSIAFTGAMCAPWLIGYVDSFLGTRYIMLIPALGSVAVLMLALLIMFEAHLMGSKNPKNEPPRVLTAAGGQG